MGAPLIFGFVLLAAIYVMWIMLVKGLLWKFLLAVGGWFGIYMFLETYIAAAKSGVTIFGTVISWSAIVPTIIVLLAMAYTKEE